MFAFAEEITPTRKRIGFFTSFSGRKGSLEFAFFVEEQNLSTINLDESAFFFATIVRDAKPPVLLYSPRKIGLPQTIGPIDAIIHCSIFSKLKFLVRFEREILASIFEVGFSREQLLDFEITQILARDCQLRQRHRNYDRSC